MFLEHRILELAGLPFENQGDDKVRVDSDSPVTLFPWRVRLRVVRRQNHTRRATDVTSTGCWGQTAEKQEKCGYCVLDCKIHTNNMKTSHYITLSRSFTNRIHMMGGGGGVTVRLGVLPKEKKILSSVGMELPTN